MLREGMTIREAAEMWVREFDAIDQGMISKLMGMEPDAWHEVTKPAVGRGVYVYDLPEDCDSIEHSGEITGYDEDEDIYIIELSDGVTVRIGEDGFEVEYDDSLPMQATMWSMHDPCDNHWLEDGDGISALSECGFRVYESDEFGYFFGIDAAGYDFYSEHWVPLYQARGLQWHDPATEKEAS